MCKLIENNIAHISFSKYLYMAVRSKNNEVSNNLNIIELIVLLSMILIPSTLFQSYIKAILTSRVGQDTWTR